MKTCADISYKYCASLAIYCYKWKNEFSCDFDVMWPNVFLAFKLTFLLCTKSVIFINKAGIKNVQIANGKNLDFL